MEKPDVQRVKQALIDAGLEIYRTGDAEIQVAERVRLHIMDSGIRVVLDDQLAVAFTARSQKSDFPDSEAAALFDKVRGSIGTQANPRGYVEKSAATVEVKDPVDDAKVLDVWHEVTYEKSTPDVEAVVDEVRWALEVEKYVTGR
ncbi:MAG: hypothetical protein AAGF12_26140 [Myxococcota bacterium]